MLSRREIIEMTIAASAWPALRPVATARRIPVSGAPEGVRVIRIRNCSGFCEPRFRWAWKERVDSQSEVDGLHLSETVLP